jgi:hypothetical protein
MLLCHDNVAFFKEGRCTEEGAVAAAKAGVADDAETRLADEGRAEEMPVFYMP